jgi:hypothetical protein
MKKIVKLTETDLMNIIKKVVMESEVNEQPKTITKAPTPLKGRSCPEGWYRCGGGCCLTNTSGASSGCKDGQCVYVYESTDKPIKL